MAAILIKSTNKANDDLILRLAKVMQAPVQILNDGEEADALLIKSIEGAMKSGKGSKDELKKFFLKNGVRIN